MANYLLTTPAKSDINQISQYIRRDNPTAAKKVRRELNEAMKRLAEFPGIGHIRNDLADESLRVWSVYSYLIIYRPDSKPLQVLRVIHGARDLQNLFIGR